ncbi:MAG TPA: hypothetical protein PK695_04900 [Chitinophagaceae bacterium]|jgi:hypothetical protein|nr:hypothetical protein [Chitinophagaceae bacterium]HMW65702.1 hypothetical protein [Chitinophagaceae bacterium]HNA92124.1 hypothetical protein [Chitinophagaceae bacterium]HNA96537.1 hypothetical protein [Chitinophagaceae bacterium]HNC38063.1 hypothetical protein [Chitinophagaceae bacterium]
MKILNKELLLIMGFALLFFQAGAQKIMYSEPDKDDTRRMVFEIMGKINNHYLIYKNTRANRHIVSVLDNEMKEVASVEQDYIPGGDRMINIDFFPYQDFCYLIYQYQKKNVVYCMAAKVDGMGNIAGNPVEMDTTHLGFAANNKIYSVITNEDKSKIMAFKINTKNKRSYLLSTKLFDNKLSLLKESRLPIEMEERNEYLGVFQLDNMGNLVFSKFLRANNDNINTAQLMMKPAYSDSIVVASLNIEKTWLDEVHIKIDNTNQRYLLTSLYYKERRGNIDGYYFYVWDTKIGAPYVDTVYTFPEDLRRDARGDASFKGAFNDFFIRNIIIRKDGGFVIGSESYYTTSRFNNWNRWDYLYGQPYFNSFGNNYYSPYYNNYWMNNSRFNNNQSVRYHADNIVVNSFSDKGMPEWDNVLGKNQFDDASDDLMSYQMVNTGGSLHFLFNLQERRNNLLTDYSIAPDGQLYRNPTLKNLDKGYDFLPKYGKQVSSKVLIIPCAYRNYICFAKVEYN